MVMWIISVESMKEFGQLFVQENVDFYRKVHIS